MAVQASTLDPFPFISRGLGEIMQRNIYILVTPEGQKQRVEAPSVSVALQQSGLKDVARVERFDLLNQTIIALHDFSDAESGMPPASFSASPTVPPVVTAEVSAGV